MSLALLFLILASNLALVGGFIYVYSKVKHLARAFKEEALAFFELRGEGESQTSSFTEVVAGCSDIAAQKIGLHVQMAIKGSIGGSTRALNKELEQQAIAENPNLAMAEFLPKSLKKNPLALMGLNSIMNQVLSGQAGRQPGGPGPSDNGQAKFNL